MRSIIIIINVFLISISFNSCTKSRLEATLKLSGSNRGELEKVLLYYSEEQPDSLKYAAACFLIENMRYHYSIKNTAEVDAYYNEVDSLARLYNFPLHPKRDSLFRVINDKYKNKESDYIPDIEIITSDYLIQNIEQSFSIWKECKWAKHLDFDEFCEYILPYKVVEGQPLDNWRESFAKQFENSANDICNDIHKNRAALACEIVNKDLSNFIRPKLAFEQKKPVRRMSTAMSVPFGSCDDYAILSLPVLRAKGIPAALDFTPQYPFRSMGHSWNVVLDNFGKNLMFMGGFVSKPGNPHKEDHRKSKVFRRVYAINREIEDIYQKEKYYPPLFKEPFLKDVTTEYMKTSNIHLNINNPNKHSYAYLAVFDNQNWIPIHWGKCKRDLTTFNNMGLGNIYLPVFYTSNGCTPAAQPILLTIQGEIKIMIADTLRKQTMQLSRKFPVFPHADLGSKRMRGGRVQASNDINFLNTITVDSISKSTQFKDIRLNKETYKYRYWRYLSPDSAYCNIAELAFYKKDSLKPTLGRIIGTDGSYVKNKDTHLKKAVFDGDLLTFFGAPRVSGAWVGMDFGKKVNIERIVCVARGDGNSIEIGNEYELMYWGENNWVSMGRKIADDYYLNYDNCPTNALFILLNQTKGNEQRIFTYENGIQIWW